MLKKRIIPCLDVKNGRVVKGIQFKDIKDIGSPTQLAKYYSEQGADELVFYDITASYEERGLFKEVVENIADEISIPFSVGGGVKCLEDFDRLLKSGADKVSINSSAIDNPQLIADASRRYGKQCVVVSIDVMKVDGKYTVFTKGGRFNTGLNALSWARHAVELGAGELVINSINEDGMKQGYDLNFLDLLSDVSVPIIASGGAGQYSHFLDGASYADGLLAASVFHNKTILINDLKRYLDMHGVRVRL